MSMINKCRDCKGDECKFDPCMWNNQSYITSRHINGDRQKKRREELNKQLDTILSGD